MAYSAFAELPVKVDFAVFRYNDSLNILEIYYSFPASSLKYNDSGEGVIGFAVGIIQSESIIDSTQWIRNIKSPSNKDNIPDMVGIKTMLVPKGKLKFMFVALDMNNKYEKYKRTFSFTSPDYPIDKFSTSDLQIAAEIESTSNTRQKWSKAFKKSGLFVVPNPGNDVLGSNPKIHSYLEIYNAKKIAPAGLHILYTVYDAAHKEVFALPREKKSFSDAMVEYISIPVDALPTGVYYFTVLIKDAKDEVELSKNTRKIYVSNYNIPPKSVDEFYENMSFEQSEFATLSEERVKIFYDQIKFLASDYEKEVWDKCETLGAKQRFLYTFWSARNTDTTKTYNQLLEDFRDRIAYTNKHFKYGLMKEGWRTDRGRVYIKYGKPTRIDHFVQEGDRPPYIKWYYDEIQGGVHFVFIDFRSNGFYQLVHSNAEGEMYNYNWYEQYIERQDPDPNFKYHKSNFPR